MRYYIVCTDILQSSNVERAPHRRPGLGGHAQHLCHQHLCSLPIHRCASSSALCTWPDHTHCDLGWWVAILIASSKYRTTELSLGIRRRALRSCSMISNHAYCGLDWVLFCWGRRALQKSTFKFSMDKGFGNLPSVGRGGIDRWCWPRTRNWGGQQFECFDGLLVAFDENVSFNLGGQRPARDFLPLDIESLATVIGTQEALHRG